MLTGSCVYIFFFFLIIVLRLHLHTHRDFSFTFTGVFTLFHFINPQLINVLTNTILRTLEYRCLEKYIWILRQRLLKFDNYDIILAFWKREIYSSRFSYFQNGKTVKMNRRRNTSVYISFAFWKRETFRVQVFAFSERVNWQRVAWNAKHIL